MKFLKVYIMSLLVLLSFQSFGAEYIMRASHNFNEEHPWHKGLVKFQQLLDEKSEGKVELKIFNNGVLGSETDTMQAVKEGVLEFVVADPSSGSNFAQELDFFQLPFLFSSYEHWQKSLDGPAGQAYAALIEEKTDLKILGYWGGSIRNILAVKKPVKSIDDLKGFKLRLVPSPLKVDVWKAVGTLPAPIAYLETYTALQSGVVDGMENESIAVLSMKFMEPAPYITRTEHEITVRPLFMSALIFNALPKDIQNIIVEAAKEATVYERNLELESSKEAEDTMQSQYKTQFFDIDKTSFIERTAAVISSYMEKLNLSNIYGEIKSAQ